MPRWAIAAGVLLLLTGLPIAAWLDLRELVDRALHVQASNLNSVISSVRGYYANNVVARVLDHQGDTQVIHNYHDVPGAIPIPATLSLELGQVISQQQGDITYRFVSDYPFKGRESHDLDAFERSALVALRRNPQEKIIASSWSRMTGHVRLISPVIMGPTCVSCHNVHPDSPKRDWKVGDVRGIQEVTIAQPIAGNLFSFKWLLTYFIGTMVVGLLSIIWQNRQSRLIAGMNRELESNNAFLAAISQKISRYLSPQLYQSIFRGEKDVVIHTERKKLTIFFSDLQDFTAITEKLQPEEITLLLNEYFTEMSNIALAHGGTVNKFIGDAILIFFGDPETKGVAEDARACLRMAFEMQRQTAKLNARWRRKGIEHAYSVRMGINTGYCNVGNFGSDDRMDYTIIGAEANLASRLQSIAPPGRIVLSYETYMLVRNMVIAHEMEPIQVKGIAQPIIPYAVDSLLEPQESKLFNEHGSGFDFYLDPSEMDVSLVEHTTNVLNEAIQVLESSARQKSTVDSASEKPSSPRKD